MKGYIEVEGEIYKILCVDPEYPESLWYEDNKTFNVNLQTIVEARGNRREYFEEHLEHGKFYKWTDFKESDILPDCKVIRALYGELDD